MSLTPAQIARAVLKDRRGRGQVFQLRKKIWDWLISTPWFIEDYPEQHDRVNLVDTVEKHIRTSWSKKATKTKQAKKEQRQKERDAARQRTFKF